MIKKKVSHWDREREIEIIYICVCLCVCWTSTCRIRSISHSFKAGSLAVQLWWQKLSQAQLYDYCRPVMLQLQTTHLSIIYNCTNTVSYTTWRHTMGPVMRIIWDHPLHNTSRVYHSTGLGLNNISKLVAYERKGERERVEGGKKAFNDRFSCQLCAVWSALLIGLCWATMRSLSPNIGQ